MNIIEIKVRQDDLFKIIDIQSFLPQHSILVQQFHKRCRHYTTADSIVNNLKPVQISA